MSQPQQFILACRVCRHTIGRCQSDTPPAFVFCTGCRPVSVEEQARQHAAHSYAVAVADHNEHMTEGGAGCARTGKLRGQ